MSMRLAAARSASCSLLQKSRTAYICTATALRPTTRVSRAIAPRPSSFTILPLFVTHATAGMTPGQQQDPRNSSPAPEARPASTSNDATFNALVWTLLWPLTAVGQTAVSYAAFDEPANLQLCTAAFLLMAAQALKDRLVGRSTRGDSINAPERVNFFNENKQTLTYAVYASYAAVIMLLAAAPAPVQAVYATAVGMALLYFAPVLVPGSRGLKVLLGELAGPAGKGLFVGSMMTVLCVLPAYVDQWVSGNPVDWAPATLLALYVMANNIHVQALDDVPDIDGDQHDGVSTLPISLGLSSMPLFSAGMVGLNCALALAMGRPGLMLPQLVLAPLAAAFYYQAGALGSGQAEGSSKGLKETPLYAALALSTYAAMPVMVNWLH